MHPKRIVSLPLLFAAVLALATFSVAQLAHADRVPPPGSEKLPGASPTATSSAEPATTAATTAAPSASASAAPKSSAAASASAAASTSPPANEDKADGATADDLIQCPAEKKKEEKEPTALGKFNNLMLKGLFFDVTGGAVEVDKVDPNGKLIKDPKTGEPQKKTIGFPFLVLVLLLGALFFTFWFRFINIRAFKHAFDIVRGKFDNPDDEGEISHFRALTSALSATVGLGNIAGVAVAVVVGGPGAVVWMMIVAVFGMTAKCSSCTLAQLYRQTNDDGSISGGPMYYLDLGLKKIGPGWGTLGKVLAVVYAFMIMGGALGGGNMFQANQTVEAITSTFGLGPKASWVIGITMALLVAAVILGGIKRIGAATSTIVPLMCGLYIGASIFVIVTNIEKLPGAVSLMFSMAFTKMAFYGGIMGVIVQGVKRAAFSNEAGLGSASVAHAAAKTDEPVREGMVAMLGPFIDTIVVCFMTAMVVIISGAWKQGQFVCATLSDNLKGASVTTWAFEQSISWFPIVLTVCIALFAYSTMVSWCYYGERGWIYLLDHFDGAGLKSVIAFRIIFVLAVVLGSVSSFHDVLLFSDIMVLSMAFPNIIGSVILAPRVYEKLKEYWGRYTAGKMPTYDEQLAQKKKEEAAEA